MDFKHFPIDEFLKKREEKAGTLQDFYSGKGKRVCVSQRPGYRFTGPICRYKDKQLEDELEYLAHCMQFDSDLMLTALEPWLGVGVYAAGFGCKYMWTDTAAPQTRTIIKYSDEIAQLKLKELSDWPEMQAVLERIRYFKQETNGLIGITLTDTQSPNDTASLIMDTTEFFTGCQAEPEEVAPLLNMITDAIIKYSHIQMEEIGDCFAAPGHIAISGMGVKGVTLSDDNLAILSPKAYRNASAEYIERISNEFGGMFIHSCGLYSHNMPEVFKCNGLRLMDCCVDRNGDPNPNDPAKLAEVFKGHDDVILQVRLGLDKADTLKPLLDAGIRLHVLFGPYADAQASNKAFHEFKDKYGIE